MTSHDNDKEGGKKNDVTRTLTFPSEHLQKQNPKETHKFHMAAEQASPLLPPLTARNDDDPSSLTSASWRFSTTMDSLTTCQIFCGYCHLHPRFQHRLENIYLDVTTPSEYHRLLDIYLIIGSLLPLYSLNHPHRHQRHLHQGKLVLLLQQLQPQQQHQQQQFSTSRCSLCLGRKPHQNFSGIGRV